VAGLTTHAVGGCGCSTGGTCLICVTVKTCPGVAIAGENVTVSFGGTIVGTATTNSLGECCIDVTSSGSGSYIVACVKTGYIGGNKTVTVACSGTTNVVLIDAPTSGGYSRFFHVYGCNSTHLQGATFIINGGTYTSDVNGLITYPIPPPGSYPVSLSWLPAFVTITATQVVNSGCSIVSGAFGDPTTMTVASGYVCPGYNPICGAVPWPITLYCTHPVGSTTLTWGGGNNWYGCGTWPTTVTTGSPTCTGTGSGNGCYSVTLESSGIFFALTTYFNALGTAVICNGWTHCADAPTLICTGSGEFGGGSFAATMSITCLTPGSSVFGVSGTLASGTGPVSITNAMTGGFVVTS
jgi:hypothetical protein